MKRATFYICRRCGNIVMKVNDGGGTLSCCGADMEILEPNTTEAAAEKHIPVATIDNGVISIQVGEVEHPMAEDHYIEWVYLVTECGAFSACLHPGDKPSAQFFIGADKPIAAFAYCNKHGLWKADL